MNNAGKLAKEQVAKERAIMDNVSSLLTFKNFKKWVETKSDEEKYNYSDKENCALAQFAHSMGFPETFAGSTYVHEKKGSWHIPVLPTSYIILDVATNDNGKIEIVDQTFGGIKQRIKNWEKLNKEHNNGN